MVVPWIKVTVVSQNVPKAQKVKKILKKMISMQLFHSHIRNLCQQQLIKHKIYC